MADAFGELVEVLTLTDANGKPLEDVEPHVHQPDEDPKQAARRLTRERWQQHRGGFRRCLANIEVRCELLLTLLGNMHASETAGSGVVCREFAAPKKTARDDRKQPMLAG